MDDYLKYFCDINSNSKYFFKIIDLDENYEDLREAVDEAFILIYDWHGLKYVPDFFLNLSVKDDAILPSKVTKGVKEGISKLVSSTYSLIITPGRSRGTTRVVGETVANAFKITGLTKEEKNVKLLGITNWNEHKFSPGFKYNFHKEENQEDKEAKLDKNHSHFILVKSEKDPNAWLQFKDQLQNRLSQETSSVFLALNGDHTLLDRVINCLENNLPVLLVLQSKGVTDLLASIIKKYTELSYDEKELILEKNVEATEKFFREFKKELKKGNNEVEKFIKIISVYQKVVDETDAILINTVNFDDGEDLETAILKTITKANNDMSEDQKKSKDIIRLALKWNKVKIGHDILDYLNNNYGSYDTDYYKVMEEALVYNRPGFLKLFLDGFEADPNFIANFLTARRLYYLYNFKNEEEDVIQAPFSILFKKKENSFFSFKSIRNILNEKINIELKKDFLSRTQEINDFNTKFDTKDSLFSFYINGDYETPGFEILDEYPTIENLEPNLFIWAILFNRIEIAKIVLSKLSNQIGFCLLASIILKEFYVRSNEKSFLESSEQFEIYAVEILDLFDKGEDDTLNYKLLQTEIKYFGKSILQLAYSGNRQKFITTFGVQKCLHELWNNGYVENDRCRIDSDSNKLQFHRFHLKDILSFFSFGTLAPFLMYSVTTPNKKTKEENNELKVICENNQNEGNEKNENDENNDNFLNEKNIEEKEDENDEKDQLLLTNHNIQQSYKNKYKNFICSPRSHFIYETFFYLLFLFTFSYLMLCEFKFVTRKEYDQNFTSFLNESDTDEREQIEEAKINWVEFLITFWVFSFFCRMIFEILVWLEWNVWNTWNYFNVVGCLFFIIGITLRFISYLNGSKNFFKAARLTLCVDLCIWIFRSLYILMCFSNLGPKLVMIKKMLKDLFSFIAIISIFLFAYGITTHAILYPGSEFGTSLFSLLIDLSYWPLFGQITLLSLVENKTFPTDAKVYGYVMTSMYMFIANVLLLNLLIAMFSNTFNTVEENAHEIWVFQNFKLIFEYRLSEIKQIKLWPIPPPFNLVNFPVFFAKYFAKKKKNKINRNQDILINKQNGEDYGIIIEKIKSYSELVLEKENKQQNIIESNHLK